MKWGKVSSQIAYNHGQSCAAAKEVFSNTREIHHEQTINQARTNDVVRHRVAEKRPEVSKADVEAITDSLWATIREEVTAGTVVPIAGFGIFELKDTPARTGRNPQSGEAIKIAAPKSVRFRVPQLHLSGCPIFRGRL